MPCCESQLFTRDGSQIRATSTSVVLGVVADAYIATVTQSFTSRVDVHDATFRFPLDDGAVVTHFKVSVNGVVRVGEVKPKQAARNEYNAAVSSGKSAQLLAQKTKDLFELSLGNFGANDTVIITFTYAAQTRFMDGTLSLHVPLFSKHRYGEAMQANQRDASMSDVASSGGTVSIYVNGNVAGGLKSFTSVNHDVTLTDASINCKSGATCDLAGKPTFSLNFVLKPKDPSKQDFVLHMAPVNPFAARAVCETDPESGNQALMLSIMPELPEAGNDDPQTSEIIFVCDTSGSMNGNPLAQAKEALGIFVDSLPIGTAFNIARFSDDYEFFSKVSGSRVLTEANESKLRQDAKSFINSFQARGGTELFRPVEVIATDVPLDGRRRNVVVLSDGATDQEWRVTSAIASSAGNTRWFAIGLGEGASRSMCNNIARTGNGTAEFSANATVLAQVVMRLQQQCLQPSVRFSVDWASGYKAIDSAPALVAAAKVAGISGIFAAVSDAMAATTSAGDPAPNHLQAVPDNMRVAPDKQKIVFTTLRETSFGLVVDPKQGVWEGTDVPVHLILPSGETHTFRVPVETIGDTAINSLAAHAVIRDLEVNNSRAQVIEEIAMSRHVISSQTSMLVVNPNATAPAQAATLRSRSWSPDIDTDIDQGWVVSYNSTRSYNSTCSMGYESCVNDSDDHLFLKKKKVRNDQTPKLADIISANKGGLWTFGDVVKFLPAEARVWGPEKRGSDLWVTIAVLKLLQSDYFDQVSVWSAIAKNARAAIKKKFSEVDISAVLKDLQFSF